jgi:hypothetical protein
MEQNQATFFLFFIFVCLLKRICLCLYFYLHFYFSSFHFFLSFFQYVSTLFYFDLMEINIRLFAYHIKKNERNITKYEIAGHIFLGYINLKVYKLRGQVMAAT